MAGKKKPTKIKKSNLFFFWIGDIYYDIDRHIPKEITINVREGSWEGVPYTPHPALPAARTFKIGEISDCCIAYHFNDEDRYSRANRCAVLDMSNFRHIQTMIDAIAELNNSGQHSCID